MIHATPEFMENAREPYREIACRVILETSKALVLNETVNVDEYVGGTIHPLNDGNDRGIPRQIVDDVQDISYRYAMLDGSWALGEEWCLASETIGKRGWVSMSLSGASGIFDPPVSVIVKTDGTLKADSSNSVLVAFDNRRNEWPVDFEVVLLAGGSIIPVAEILGNSEVALTVPLSVEEDTPFSGYGIRVRRWNIPGRTIKVALCYLGNFLEFREEDILNMRITSESGSMIQRSSIGSVVSSRLVLEVANSMSVLNPQNPEGHMYGINPERLRVMPSAGFMGETVALGTFYVQNWPVDDQRSILTITAQDIVSLLGTETYNTEDSNLVYPCSISDVIFDALNQTGISIHVDFPDEALPIVYRPLAGSFGLRQLIVKAAVIMRCRAVASTTGALSFLTSQKYRPPDLLIPLDDYFSLSVPSFGSQPYAGVEVEYTNADGTKDYARFGYWDQKGLILSITGNELIQTNRTATDVAYAAWLDLRYGENPKNLEWRGNPVLEIGDNVGVEDRFGGMQVVNVENMTLSVSGGMQSTISGSVIPYDVHGTGRKV